MDVSIHFGLLPTQLQIPDFSLLILILYSSPFTIWLPSCWAFRETTGQIPRSHPPNRSIFHCQIINWQPWFRNLSNMHLAPRKLTHQVSKLAASRVHTAKTIETSLKQHTCLVFPFWERISSPLFNKLLLSESMHKNCGSDLASQHLTATTTPEGKLFSPGEKPLIPFSLLLLPPCWIPSWQSKITATLDCFSLPFVWVWD